MPSFCNYGMCHNLGSSSYQGYCDDYHRKKGVEQEKLLQILKENPQLSTLKDARLVASLPSTSAVSPSSPEGVQRPQ